MKNPRQNKKNVYLMLMIKKLAKKIDNGSFGIINLVQNKQTGANYETKTNIIQNSRQHKFFISREARFLIHVQHPTINQKMRKQIEQLKSQFLVIPSLQSELEKAKKMKIKD